MCIPDSIERPFAGYIWKIVERRYMGVPNGGGGVPVFGHFRDFVQDLLETLLVGHLAP